MVIKSAHPFFVSSAFCDQTTKKRVGAPIRRAMEDGIFILSVHNKQFDAGTRERAMGCIAKIRDLIAHARREHECASIFQL